MVSTIGVAENDDSEACDDILQTVSGIRYQGEHECLFERHSLALFGLNFFSILVNNLETKIEMKEYLENRPFPIAVVKSEKSAGRNG